MRRQAPAIQDQLLDLRGEHVHPADYQHVIAAPGDLRETAHRGDASRQEAGEIARAVADHGHGFLGERGEDELARFTLAEHLAALRIDDLGQEMILPDRRAFLGLGEFLRDAGTHHLRQAVDVTGIDTEGRLDLLPYPFAPGLRAEYADG